MPMIRSEKEIIDQDKVKVLSAYFTIQANGNFKQLTISSEFKHKYQHERYRVAIKKINKMLKKLNHDLQTFRYWEK